MQSNPEKYPTQENLSIFTSDITQKMPALEAALTLGYLAPVSGAQEVCDALANRITEFLTANWILKGPLHEVFMCFRSLAKYDESLVSGEYLAYAVKRLFLAEVAPGGPYKDGEKISVAGSAAIAAFLEQVADVPAALTVFLQQWLKTRSLYGSTVPFALTEALVNSVLNVNSPMHYVPVGSYGDFVQTARQTFLVADEIGQRQQSKIIQRSNVVYKKVQAIWDTTDEVLRKDAEICTARVRAADKNHEIALLPWMFACSVKTDVNNKLIDELGVANVLCWLAYTVFDDYIDGDPKAQHLPVATLAMRYALKLLNDNQAGQKLVSEVFDAMDAVESWELGQCRFSVTSGKIHITSLPDYSDIFILARRSLGHILGPLIIATTEFNAEDTQKISVAFRNYLIARQLCDDLFDWQEDLQAGSISFVVRAILKDAEIKPGVYEIEKIMPILQQTFATKSLRVICNIILRHTQTARQTFMATGLFYEENKIFTILDNLERTARKPILEQKREQAFKNVYSKL